MIDYSKFNKKELFDILVEASRLGVLKIVKKMIEELNVNPKAEESFPLLTAAKNGNFHVVKYLISQSDNYELAAASAVKGNQFEIFKYLVDNYVEIDNINYHELQKIAYCFGYTKIEDYLEKLFLNEASYD